MLGSDHPALFSDEKQKLRQKALSFLKQKAKAQ
jgi:hypothetical protein